jgi:hypothetical protein
MIHRGRIIIRPLIKKGRSWCPLNNDVPIGGPITLASDEKL